MEDGNDKINIKKIWYDTTEMLTELILSRAGYYYKQL